MFIFDFRVRPPFDPTTQSIMGDELNKYYEICNDTPAARSVVHKDMGLFWQELADATGKAEVVVGTEGGAIYLVIPIGMRCAEQ